MCDGTLPLHRIFCCDPIAETKFAVTLDRGAHDPPGLVGDHHHFLSEASRIRQPTAVACTGHNCGSRPFVAGVGDCSVFSAGAYRAAWHERIDSPAAIAQPKSQMKYGVIESGLGARLERFMQHDSYAAWNHFDKASSPSGPATMVRAAPYEGSVGHVQVFRLGGQGTSILEDHRSLYPDYFRQ